MPPAIEETLMLATEGGLSTGNVGKLSSRCYRMIHRLSTSLVGVVNRAAGSLGIS